jgi:hypothetical protein
VRFDGRIERLTEQLLHGLPLHKPVAEWSDRDLIRAEQPEVLASLPMPTLERLLAEFDEMGLPESEPLTRPSLLVERAPANSHGWGDAFAWRCECSGCVRSRR